MDRAEKGAKTLDAEAKCEIVDGADFVLDIKPPQWLVDGVIQRSYLYGLTALANHGKTAVAALLAVSVGVGIPFAGRECERGHVLYLAGENPEDFKLRLKGACQALNVEVSQIADRISVLPTTGALTEFIAAIKEYSLRFNLSLVIIDTAAAYFSYKDENDNVDNRLHAQDMRSLISAAGNPAVVSLCHPIKNADEDNLVPRGGGGFGNEIDTNLTLYKKNDVIDFSYNKIRGPAFQPIQFEIQPIKLDGIVDSKGRPVHTVVVKHLTEAEAAARDDQAYKDLRSVLFAVQQAVARSQRSIAAIATACEWFTAEGGPYKTKAQRVINFAISEKLLKREAGAIEITTKGRDFLGG
jgi:hypothetical protein